MLKAAEGQHIIIYISRPGLGAGLPFEPSYYIQDTVKTVIRTSHLTMQHHCHFISSHFQPFQPYPAIYSHFQSFPASHFKSFPTSHLQPCTAMIIHFQLLLAISNPFQPLQIFSAIHSQSSIFQPFLNITSQSQPFQPWPDILSHSSLF